MEKRGVQRITLEDPCDVECMCPEKSHGQRSLVGCSLWVPKAVQITANLNAAAPFSVYSGVPWNLQCVPGEPGDLAVCCPVCCLDLIHFVIPTL